MEDEQKLSVVFRSLQERGLYFIDSRTTPHSQAAAAAKRIPIRFASRTLFLDNDNNQELIYWEMKFTYSKRNQFQNRKLFQHQGLEYIWE